uniref:Uncharacterized protein n=1 Tax=Lates calcarifer TaxID=8187 RepID=A0A4W6BK16_LATCA
MKEHYREKLVEQHINLNFLVKLNKTAAESFGTLYGEHCMSRARREDVKDDERSGRLSIRMRAEMVSTDKETVQQILHENLSMTKVCAKVVPKLLTPDQKEKQFLLFHSLSIPRGAGAYLSCHWVRGGVHSVQTTTPSQGQHRDKQPFTLTFTPNVDNDDVENDLSQR